MRTDVSDLPLCCVGVTMAKPWWENTDAVPGIIVTHPITSEGVLTHIARCISVILQDLLQQP